MSTSAGFDASLPRPYKENWREAYRSGDAENPRLASYQAPGDEAIPFIQKGFRFSGGQSQDTAEYPFGGLWSNEYLNEKPQSLTVEGYLRGSAYIARRNSLIEALRVPTDDDNPGYIDLPFWGRFPVVVDDNYEISETADEQGQCAVSISFTRAGVSVTERLTALPSDDARLEQAMENLQTAAVDDFEARLTGDGLPGSPAEGGDSEGGSSPGNGDDDGGGSTGGGDGEDGSVPEDGDDDSGGSTGSGDEGGESDPGDDGSDDGGPGPGDNGNSGGSSPEGGGSDGGGSVPGGGGTLPDNAAFASGFSQLKDILLAVIGRIQGAKTTLNAMTGAVTGIINLINRGVRAPRELAQALFNAGVSIAGGVVEIKNSAALYGRDRNNSSDSKAPGSTAHLLPQQDNERNTLIQFLSARAFTLSGETVTVRQETTKTAIENLYRTMAFLTAARVILNQDSLTHKKAGGYWRLMEELEESIDRENPAVYAALQDLRAALSRELSRRELSMELTRRISAPSPVLYLAFHLGCDEEKIRELNDIADSFVIEGDVIYV